MINRHGFSFVEILMALGIMALALVPIVSIIQHSHYQIADEKAEKAVANFADTIFNKALFKQTYEEVVSDSGEEVIDGTTIRWNLEVAEVSNFALQFQRVRYHEPCGASGCNKTVELLDPETRTAAEIDVKYGGGVLKTLQLTLQWRPYYQSFDEEDNRKILVLGTRKARLE